MKRRKFLKGLGIGAAAVAVGVNPLSRSEMSAVDQIDENTRKEIISGGSEINHLHGVSISVSKDLEREEILELGRRGPYHRFVDFPVEITAELEVTKVDYSFPIDENFTEEITMVSRGKMWETPKEEKPVSNAIDWELKYADRARYDIIPRAADLKKVGMVNNHA